MTNEDIVVKILAYSDAAEMYRQGRREAGRRFAAFLRIPAETDGARRVLGQLLGVFIERAYVPPSPEDPEFREESWSAAGFAAPRDEDLAAEALRGFGLAGKRPHGTIMHVCYALMQELFLEALVQRGYLERMEGPRLIELALRQPSDDDIG